MLVAFYEVPEMKKKIVLLVSVLFWSAFSVFADVHTIVKENVTILDGDNLIFEIIPVKAQVVIDGEQKYSIEDGTLALGIPEGEHDYEISAPGYQSFKGKVKVVTHETVKMKIALDRQQSGILDIAAFPDDVEITNGDRKYGSVLELDNLPVGNYHFSFVKKGYLAVDTTFIVKDGIRSFGNIVLSPIGITSKKVKRTWDVLLLPQAGYNDDLSLGLMLGLMRKNGFYLKALTSLKAPKTDYMCNETGVIQEGELLNYPYYKEKVLHSQYAVSVGYLRELWKPLILYVGTGYGSHKVVWETIDGAKVNNKDLSASGVVAECGAILRLKWLVISCGIQSVDFSYSEVQFGLGIIF